jgi:hypothetical protein
VDWTDATLNYRARLVAVYETRFYRLLMGDKEGWQEALGKLQEAKDEYLKALREAGR